MHWLQVFFYSVWGCTTTIGILLISYSAVGVQKVTKLPFILSSTCIGTLIGTIELLKVMLQTMNDIDGNQEELGIDKCFLQHIVFIDCEISGLFHVDAVENTQPLLKLLRYFFIHKLINFLEGEL